MNQSGSKQNKDVTVYTIDHCPFCTNAKNLLAELKIQFNEVHVDRNDTATRTELLQRSGMKTFPQIFFGKNLVGEFTDLKKLHDTGALLLTLAAD